MERGRGGRRRKCGWEHYPKNLVGKVYDAKVEFKRLMRRWRGGGGRRRRKEGVEGVKRKRERERERERVKEEYLLEAVYSPA